MCWHVCVTWILIGVVRRILQMTNENNRLLLRFFWQRFRRRLVVFERRALNLWRDDRSPRILSGGKSIHRVSFKNQFCPRTRWACSASTAWRRIWSTALCSNVICITGLMRHLDNMISALDERFKLPRVLRWRQSCSPVRRLSTKRLIKFAMSMAIECFRTEKLN